MQIARMFYVSNCNAKVLYNVSKTALNFVDLSCQMSEIHFALNIQIRQVR